jgi:formamidopyrimidine-DNA glycosylase
MPELPEIETIADGLRREITGRRIIAVTVREPRLRQLVAPDLPARLRERQITQVSRRGKFLIFQLDEGKLEWIAHLGMSGRLCVGAPPQRVGRHDHVVIDLDDGRCLTYSDPRRFGLILVRPAGGGLPARLGIDPMESGFTAAALQLLGRRRRRPIKNLLMDQALVAGLGNIYTNEILFRARIRPGRAAGRLTWRECDAIVRAARSVLREAIRRRGSSISDFRDAGGNPGGFQARFRVYDRAGAPCRRCGIAIRRRVLSGRSTFYCPSCQR